MKLNKCDICKKEVGEYQLSTLYQKYQFDDIEHVCSDCEKQITKAQRAIDAAINPIRNHWIKEVLRKMMGNGK